MLDKVQNWLEDLAVIANRNKQTASLNKNKYTWYSRQKNKDIKRKLSEESEKLPTNGNRLSSRSSGKSTGKEWLYDFTLRNFDKDNNLIGIELVVEIELSDTKTGGLVYDFNKLLQADSPNKCFIFQQKHEETATTMLERLNLSINKYNHRTKSHFLIACWVTSKYKFVYKIITTPE